MGQARPWNRLAPDPLRPPHVPTTHSDPLRARSMANAARHAVLRRVAPALRHDMVVNLQGVSMMAELLHVRMERGALALAELQASVAKLNKLARDAVAACLQVTGWIESGDDDAVELQQGVEECVRLLTPSFSFRGFTIATAVPAGSFEVRHNALRSLLTASLVGMADGAEHPCEFLVSGSVRGDDAILMVRCQDQTETPVPTVPAASDSGPRPTIEWPEVQALAAAEGAELVRNAAGITLRLPRAVVTSPMQLAPV
jgi:hypothetical protein